MNVEESLGKLGRAVLEQRQRDQQSLRKVGIEMDVSFNAISRLEQGKLPTPETLFKILLWCDKTKPYAVALLESLQ